MPPDWDQFAATGGRVDWGLREVTIHNHKKGPYAPTTGRYGDGGWVAVATLRAEVTEPNANQVMMDASGIESEVDAEIYLPDDVLDNPDVDLITTHAEERATVIEDQLSGKSYSLRELFFENNGQIRVSATETSIELGTEAAA